LSGEYCFTSIILLLCLLMIAATLGDLRQWLLGCVTYVIWVLLGLMGVLLLRRFCLDETFVSLVRANTLPGVGDPNASSDAALGLGARLCAVAATGAFLELVAVRVATTFAPSARGSSVVPFVGLVASTCALAVLAIVNFPVSLAILVLAVPLAHLCCPCGPTDASQLKGRLRGAWLHQTLLVVTSPIGLTLMLAVGRSIMEAPLDLKSDWVVFVRAGAWAGC